MIRCALLSGKRHDRRGFEVLELFLVMVVLAVLAAIVLPKFAHTSRQGAVTQMQRDLKILRAAIDKYQTDTGCYPLSISDLTAQAAPKMGLDSQGKRTPITGSEWRGPYLERLPAYPFAAGHWVYLKSPPDVGRVRPEAPYANL